jgi:hypothetical protein
MIVEFPKEVPLWGVSLSDNVFVAKPKGPFRQLRMLSTRDHGFPNKIDVFTGYDTGYGQYIYIVNTNEVAYTFEPAGDNTEWSVERFLRIAEGMEFILHSAQFILLPPTQVPISLFGFSKTEPVPNAAGPEFLYMDADKYTGANMRVFLGKPGQMKPIEVLSERRKRGWGTEMRTCEGTLFISVDQSQKPIWIDKEGFVSLLDRRDVTYPGGEIFQLGIPKVG